MGDQHDRDGRRQGVDHGGDLGSLVVRGLGIAGGLVRRAPAEEVEGAAPGGGEEREQAVVEPQVVREAVHEHDGRVVAGMFVDVDAVAEMGDGVEDGMHAYRRHPFT